MPKDSARLKKDEADTAPEPAEKKTKTSAPTTAKAGKRSAKSIAEKELAESKKARIADAAAAQPDDKKQSVKPPRSRIDRAGKRYRDAAKLIDQSKAYGLVEAAALIVKTSPTNFDASVEMHVNLKVDPKQADQNIREMVVLPSGTGKTIRIAVAADGADVEKAKKAGADIAGIDELFKQLDKEQLDFDVLIATPILMGQIGKYARLLGPRGLMPSPKSGTVTSDVAKAVTEARTGKVEYRVDATGIVHLAVGKVSFGADKISQNADAVLASLRAAKPASVKGVFMNSAYLTTTMGPSIRLQI